MEKKGVGKCPNVSHRPNPQRGYFIDPIVIPLAWQWMTPKNKSSPTWAPLHPTLAAVGRFLRQDAAAAAEPHLKKASPLTVSGDPKMVGL